MIDINPTEVRKSVIKMLHQSKASHLGSNMSAVEMLIAMYGSVDCEKISKQDKDRSRIIVSKGHCAAATYATMAYFNIIPRSLLDTYHLEGSFLTGHVNHLVPGVEHSTGALGHGINVALGCALGLRSRGYQDAQVLTLLGDGEIQEGSVWEALMYAGHQKIENFIVLVDNNRISSITKTENVINMNPLSNKFVSFGLHTYEVDGHSVSEISDAIEKIRQKKMPGVIICNTVKGKDIPFAEEEPIWHYKTMTDHQFNEAITHLELLDSQ